MSETNPHVCWNLSDSSQLTKIAEEIATGMNQKFIRMIPRGYDGKVETVNFTDNDYAIVTMNGSYESGKKARLRYRLKLEPATGSWILKSFVELQDNRACMETCQKECIVHSQFPNTGYFEEAIKEYIEAGCDKSPQFGKIAIHTISRLHDADVYVYDSDAPGGEQNGCHYRLKMNDNHCWQVSDWECQKRP